MKTRSRKPRRGASLIELVLLIGSVTMILGICGSFMHMLLKLEGAGRAAIVDANNLSRLARHFRSDVRAASKAKVGPERAAVTLSTQEGRTVEYRDDGDGASRTEREGETLVRRELYRLVSIGPARFEERPGSISLVLPRRGDAPRPGYVIEARPGKRQAAGGGE